MPLPTAITCAGSWPEPDPWMTETLSSRGASARMIRLYSGMYLSVSGLASAMPLSISGTNCLGSLTNFFTTCLRWSRFAVHGSYRGVRCLLVGGALRPRVGERLEHDGDGHGTRVEGADRPLAGVGGPAALGEHAAGGFRLLAGDQRGGLERRRGRLAAPGLLLERVHRGHQGVEQGLVAHVGL